MAGYLQGQCTWPVPSSHTITSGYGPRRAPTAGASTWHDGIDIGAGTGTTIVAVAPGKVTVAGTYGGYGNYVEIDHGQGFHSFYGHMSSIGTSRGRSVAAGDRIGAVGSTGISTGPHLHFGTHLNGKTTNPLNYVSTGRNSYKGDNTAPGSSGTTTTAKPIPYKEYFVTKPKNFTDVKDSVISTSNFVKLTTKNKRVKTAENDWKKIINYYPSDGKSNLDDLKNIYDLTPKGLLSQYKQMLELFERSLRDADNPVEGQSYILFANNKIGYPHEIIYTGVDGEYYQIKSEDWLNLYKEIYIKKKTLEYYIEASQKYSSVLNLPSYINGLRKELSFNDNNILNNLYIQMEKYVKEHSEEFNDGNTLNNINAEIAECTIGISELNQELKKNYSDRDKLLDELDKYSNLLQNLKEVEKTFKQDNFSDTYTYWNKNIIKEPNLLNFWLEFSNSNEMNNYVVKNIGRKGYSATDEKVTSIYYREIPQVIYYNSGAEINKTKTGYIYLQVNDVDTMFKNSAQGISAKAIIDDLLYQHTYCTQELNLSIVPIHYLEPNTRIMVYNENTKTNNEYIIDKISNPINYSGTMTVNATQVSERLY